MSVSLIKKLDISRKRNRERAERAERRAQEEQNRQQQAQQREDRRRERAERSGEPRPERRRREDADYELPPVQSSTTSLANLFGVLSSINTEEENN